VIERLLGDVSRRDLEFIFAEQIDDVHPAVVPELANRVATAA